MRARGRTRRRRSDHTSGGDDAPGEDLGPPRHLIVVWQAGGTVADINGHPPDFIRSLRLGANRGTVAIDGRFRDEVIPLGIARTVVRVLHEW